MTLRTRKPTGQVAWPLVLVEGEEKALRTLPERFWRKVTFTDTCWLWTGATTGHPTRPYGVSWNGERRVKAHRWALEATGTALPAGTVPDHLCKVTLCVRPSHMEVVTVAENIRRGDAPGPRAVRDGTCKRGHPFTSENTYQKPSGGRECRVCARANKRAYKARNRAR